MDDPRRTPDPDALRELLRGMREVELKTRRRVQDSLAGRYRSVFKGRGVDLDQVREYVPGDDVRTIDWNVTARTGRPHVKEHVEERQLTLLLLVDVSPSSGFGSSEKDKRRVAAELASLLAFSAIDSDDRVGLVLFTDRVERYVPPGKGRRHVLKVIREILAAEPAGRGTDLVDALDFTNRMTRRPAVVFLISDFLTNGDRAEDLEALEDALRLTRVRHDLVAVRVEDPRERALPNVGWIVLEDPETGELVEIDTSRRKVRDRFAALTEARAEELRAVLRRARVDALDLRTDDDPIRPISAFFDKRERRAR